MNATNKEHTWRGHSRAVDCFDPEMVELYGGRSLVVACARESNVFLTMERADLFGRSCCIMRQFSSGQIPSRA